MLSLQVIYEDLLAKALAREAGTDPAKDLHSRLLAGLLIAGNRAASRQWVASDGRLNLARLRTAVVELPGDRELPAPSGSDETQKPGGLEEAKRRS